ncbi:unnamed protein product [Rotaria sp. Silwood1]|nr:unnamed protein product [Rotaria sp. Silwood1]
MPRRHYLQNKTTGKKYPVHSLRRSTCLPKDEKLQRKFNDHIQLSASDLPHKVDLRSKMTPIKHQGDTNSCAATAFAGALEYLLKKSSSMNIDISRLFVYYNARIKDNGPNKNVKDEGSIVTGALEALKEFGRPNEKAHKAAQNKKIVDALQIDVDLNEMKTCLAQDYSFAFGLLLFQSFDKGRKNGVIPTPKPEEASRKTHDGPGEQQMQEEEDLQEEDDPQEQEEQL